MIDTEKITALESANRAAHIKLQKHRWDKGEPYEAIYSDTHHKLSLLGVRRSNRLKYRR